MKYIAILLTALSLSGCSTLSSKNVSSSKGMVQEGIIIGISSESKDEEKHYLGQEVVALNHSKVNDNIYSIQLQNKKVIIIKQDYQQELSLGKKVNIIVLGNKAEIKVAH